MQTLTLLAIKFQKNKDKIDFKYKNEFCIEGKGNYIQQMMLFRFQGRLYLVLGRKSGLIQLYENTLDENNGKGRSYKLYKEWKHSNMNAQDYMVGLGFVNDQYLYSCSSEGKLIFRDLINDDADESYRIYLIHKPISCIEVKVASDNKLIAVCSGKNNELKIYEIENKHDQVDEFTKTLDHFFLIPLADSDISLSYDLVDLERPMLQLQRRSTSLNLRSSLNERQIHTLMPVWMSSLTQQDYVYHTSPMDSISNWIVSICLLPLDSGMIICGTQFGSVIVYDIDKDTIPRQTLQLSQFSITTLKLFSNGKYLLWTDSMSKAGVIKMSNLKTTNQYNHLKIGPMSSCKVIVNDVIPSRKLNEQSSLSNFEPIYLMCSTIDKRLAIYKLYDDNSYEMIFNLQTNTLIPAINILTNGKNEYAIMDQLIRGAEFHVSNLDPPPKKRSDCQVSKTNPTLDVSVTIQQKRHSNNNDNDNDNEDDNNDKNNYTDKNNETYDSQAKALTKP